MGFEVFNHHQGAQMTSSFLTSTRRTLVGALLSTAALTAMASPALANPNNNNNDPNNPPPPPPPIAVFKITPNPVVENGGVLQITGGDLGGIGGIQPVKAAALTRGVKFDASGSAGAGINKYNWDLDADGTYETHSTQPVVFKRYPTAGTYHVHLTVEGTNGEAQVATHDLLVHKAPKAAIAASLAAPLIGQQVSFNAAGSSDDNGIAKYQWDLDGDGTFETNSGTTPTASSSYQTLGQRKVQVRVTDIYGAIGSASVSVDVNRAPTAAFTFAPSPAVVGETVQFDGSPTADDEPIANYAWDLDGNGT